MSARGLWSLPTLALMLGCASRSAGPNAASEPSPEIAEAPRPGEPVVTLIDPGAAPRSPLRYRFSAGQKTALVVDMDVSIETSMDGRTRPGPKMPAARATLAIEILDVAPDGTSRIVSTIRGMDVRARPDDPPREVAAMKAGLDRVIGMATEMSLTSRGLARDAKVHLPEGMPPQVQTTMQSMRNMVEQVAAIFPFEAVGDGARWRVESAPDTGTLQMSQSTIMTLDRREANRVLISMTIEQTAREQPINLPALPAGARATLARYTGKGEGRVDAALDSRTLNGRAALKANSLIRVVTADGRWTADMDMDVEMTYAPAATP